MLRFFFGRVYMDEAYAQKTKYFNRNEDNNGKRKSI